MKSMVRARACSSVGNVGYGFDVFGLAVDIAADEVEISPGPSGLLLSISGRDADAIPTDPAANTAGRAVMALLEKCGIAPALKLRIHKGTRSGSGLGSSAASAAAAVVAANSLLELNLSNTELTLLAAEGERASAGAPHTDNVAAAIHGGFVIFSNESPPRVAAVRPSDNLRIVLALPAIRVNTKDARAVLPQSVSVPEFSRGAARAALSALALAKGDIDAFGKHLEGSIFESARTKLVPGFAAACTAARKAGGLGCIMSGAGPTTAAICRADQDAAAIAAALKSGFASAGIDAETFVARPGPPASLVEARP